MKLAIMQPYIFPYIGYFQLINTVDKFVFYDDVNYIKRGWINRNKLLINQEEKLFTIPVLKASQNKLINEIEIEIDEKWLQKFNTTLEQNYKKAPFFDSTYQLIQDIFSTNHKSIADLAIDSIIKISNHLELTTVFEKSSFNYSDSKGLEKANRLINITKKNEATTYINPAGGKELYDKAYFKTAGVELLFIQNEITEYDQKIADFIGGLSIIDVLMFNSKKEIQNLLTNYQLV